MTDLASCAVSYPNTAIIIEYSIRKSTVQMMVPMMWPSNISRALFQSDADSTALWYYHSSQKQLVFKILWEQYWNGWSLGHHLVGRQVYTAEQTLGLFMYFVDRLPTNKVPLKLTYWAADDMLKHGIRSCVLLLDGLCFLCSSQLIISFFFFFFIFLILLYMY